MFYNFFQSDIKNKQIDHIISGLQLQLTEEFGALIREYLTNSI
jgi:hypothetical protein